MTIQEAIKALVKRLDLTEEEMISVMEEIMTGEATPGQIGAFITALRFKGETVPEITGAARVMRAKATPISVGGGRRNLVDTCGTGGDERGTFNISTASAFVAAGAGATVAKHGNRSVSSKSGSADVLAALGVNIEAPKEVVEEAIERIGIGFLFAPMLHGAMKYAGPVRREIGIRTIFNILGPLTNPAGAKCQLLGVYDDTLTDTMAKVLANLGSDHAFVVHGSDGLDEITLTGETKISELKEGSVHTYHVEPEDFSLEGCTLEDLRGGGPKDNARIILDILNGKGSGPARDVVLLNSGAAICSSGLTNSIEEGIAVARGVVDSGRALDKLNQLKDITNG